ncbi:hypothetical protein GCM10027436_04410 [Actinophytocola sediminis]
MRIEAYELLHQLVFDQITRKVETRRGHLRCAVSVYLLADDCLDHFHDDMEAVLDDLFAHARTPIHNLEGWVRKRLLAATVNAYRRRRGERGAQQRPRLPGWLADRLGADTRLRELAVSMLEFVGVERAAGLEIWPIDAWAARRAADDSDYDTARRAVLRDIATVLTAMRARPKWYADYVERPLGRKRIPLMPAPRTESPPPIATEETEQTRLVELAALAIAAIEARLGRGEEPKVVLVEVLTTVFGADPVVAELDRPAGFSATADEVVGALLTDSSSIDRLVAEVLDILARPGG